ncbi:MAG: lipopolysaccharide biosynthesis protein, partial [Halanaerobiales bacterium]
MEIINKIKRHFKQLIGIDNLEFISHAKNYMTAEFFTKALGFISVPIFTRLLTPDEYGIFAIFTSIITIATVLLGLNFHGAVTRYYHEKDKNFREFLGSNILFLEAFNIIVFLIIFIYREAIAGFLEIRPDLFIIAIAVCVFTIPFKMFMSYLQTSQQSKRYSFISVTKSIVLSSISIVWVFLLTEERYLGKVYSQLIISVILFSIAIYYFIRLGKIVFNFKYIKYSMRYGIPLIPHALSGFILAYFDRIAVNQIIGSEATGLYSFAYNVGMIMNVVVMAMNKS